MTLLKPFSDLLVAAGSVARLGSRGLEQIRVAVQRLSGPLDAFESLVPSRALGVVREGLATADQGLQGITRRVEDFARQIEEPYAWFITAVNESSARLKAFTRLQNERTEALTSSYPERAAFAAALAEKASHTEHGVPLRTTAGIFYSRRDPGQAQPIWYYQSGTVEQELLNPITMSEKFGQPITIVEVCPSPSGRYVSYLVCKSTSDVSHLYIRDVSVGKDLYMEGIAGTMAADVQWRPDETGFYYMGQPKGPYRHPKTAIRYHKIGTGVESDPVIYEARNPVNWVSPKLSPNGKILVIGDYKSRSQIDYVAVDTTDPSHPIRDLVRDSTYRVHVIPGYDRFFLLTNEGAPNFRVQVLDTFGTDFSARRDFIAEAQPIIGEYNILGGEGAVAVTQNCLLIHAIVDGGSELKVYNLDGSYRLSFALPGAGQVSHLVVDRATETVSFHFESPLHAIQAMKGNLATGKVGSIHDVDLLIDPEDYLMERITFDSTDGARPTMVVVRPKNKPLDGTTQMLVHAYASGGSAKLPEFRLDHAAWLEAGGAIALVQARGGGEQGEAWVEAGLRERKLNTIRDILAATDYLVTHQYTARRHLAFWGRSWGGLLANMLIAFVPRAFAAVSPVVPMADMVRYAEMGLGEKWLDQFGDASKPEELAWMQELSPLRQLRKTSYPAVLIVCGEKDNRVGPAHSYMMTAALQHYQRGLAPILLYTQPSAGHNGIGKRAEDDQVSAMMLAFLWRHTR